MGHSLLAVFLLAKTAVLWDRQVAWSLTAIVGCVWQDALAVVIFLAFDALVGRGRQGRLVVTALYTCGVAYTAVNVVVTRVLATPLTLPMLRATRGALADSIFLYVTWPNLATMGSLAMVGAALPWLVGPARHDRRSDGNLPLRAVGVVILLLLVLVGPFAAKRIDVGGLHRNALVALVESMLPRVTARAAEADWTAPPFESPPSDDLSALRGAAAGRNVVLVGLESTAAGYLRAYGGDDDLTPRLDTLLPHAVVFEHAYAVTPESIKGLFSVLCSRYPAFDTPAGAYRRAPCRSLAAELTAAGYRAGLFHSGRFGYLDMAAVVHDRGFEVLEDAGHIGGNHESSFGVEEPASVERMLAWIDGLDPDDRFLLTYLPIAGHHPYATSGPGPFPDVDDWGRYRNAIHEGDRSLGTLMDGLRARGLQDKTLWIVYGDHGQAFGQHAGNYGHTFFLYEENVRVPFVVAAPGAIAGPIRSRTTVSLVDAAPTVLDMLGLPVPDVHQGRSVLPGAPQTALFFTEYSLSLVGLRDGRWKFVHDLTSDRSRLFDLERDPSETTDISSAHQVRVAAYARVLRDWSAAQKARMR
jgi:lipoteichoic acid synthase